LPETFHWIEGGAQGRLATTFHQPEGPGPLPAVLFCHGFTGNRIEPQRLFLSFARRLSLKGLAVLRFDFGGHGESEGEFHDLTLTGELKDAQAAWDFLGRILSVDATQRGLLGFSLGGYVAARNAGAFAASGLKALVLWAPTENPNRVVLHFFGLHGEEKSLSGESVDISGASIGPTFVRDLSFHARCIPGEGWFGPVFVAIGDKDQAVPLQALGVYKAIFEKQEATFYSSVIPGARHLFDRTPLRDQLYDETETFLLKYLRRGKPQWVVRS
jgi:dienelactone hydrolase